MVEAIKRTANTTAKKNTTVPARIPGGAAAASSVTPGTTKRNVSQTNKIRGAQRDNYECPVCLELCAQPVLTPCKHFLCFQCHKRVVEAGMTCPMCRAHFDKLFVPQVDQELQREIAAAMGAEYEERKAELETAGEWLGNMRLVKFAFGNTHEEVKNPKKVQD